MMTTVITKFEEDVLIGLQSSPKTIPSKYFYNEKGDALFVQIMKLPEYYLSRSEQEIFTKSTSEIIGAFAIEKGKAFNFVELGAGDGSKTLLLLKEMIKEGLEFTYMPIDISENALSLLENKIQTELNSIPIETICGDYFASLEKIKFNDRPTVVLFLGSSLGNMLDEEAKIFLEKLSNALKIGDVFLLGTDNIKDSSIVLPAYNDASGITAAFNYNLLDRMNEELYTDFKVAQFKHSPEYNFEDGVAKSYLVSLTHQSVYFPNAEMYIQFDKGEKIHTESSRKYNNDVLSQLFQKTDFTLMQQFSDSKQFFTDSLFVKK